MPYGLSDKLWKELLSALGSNPGISEAILFGSRAKGNFRPGSDVDIALKGEHLSIKDILKLQNQMDDLDHAYSYDFIIYQNISEPELIRHIDRVGIKIHSKA